ncbi:MAG: hypothetical protein RLZ42_1454 [Armatimonadota bacterium]|jgi:hypothetical protein
MQCETRTNSGLETRAGLLNQTLVYDYRHMTKIGTSMKNLKLFTASAAAVLALSVAGSAQADTYTLFSGNCIDNSNVTGSASTGVDKVYFVKDQGDLTSVTGTGNFYLRLVDNLFQVTNVSKSIVYLEGTATILQNDYAYAGINGPAFNYSGTVDYTGGLWLDPLRTFIAGTPNSNSLTGTWEFTGTSEAPKGVDYLNITVSGQGPSSAVPEPGEWAAMGMLASGLGGLVVRARRRKLA